jgi:hypothetical protein
MTWTRTPFTPSPEAQRRKEMTMLIRVIANKAIGCRAAPLNFSVGEGRAVSMTPDQFRKFRESTKADEWRPAGPKDEQLIAKVDKVDAAVAADMKRREDAEKAAATPPPTTDGKKDPPDKSKRRG